MYCQSSFILVFLLLFLLLLFIQFASIQLVNNTTVKEVAALYGKSSAQILLKWGIQHNVGELSWFSSTYLIIYVLQETSYCHSVIFES